MTPDKAVDHAMNCLRDATTDLTITKGYEKSSDRSVCQWFTLGPITNCRAHAIDHIGRITLAVQIGIVTSVQVSLTLDAERDTSILRDAVSLFATHYGMEADQ